MASFANSKSHLQRELASHVAMLGCNLPITILWAWEPHCLDALTRLSDLHVVISDRMIKYGTDLDPRVEELTDTDLLQCEAVKGFMQLRGLRRLELTKSDSYRGRSPDGPARLCRNLDRVETLIRQEVTKPRPASQKKSPYPMGIARALTLRSAVKTPSCGHPLMEEARIPSGSALADADIPRTSDGIVDLFLSRPHAMVAWIQEAVKGPASALSCRSPCE